MDKEDLNLERLLADIREIKSAIKQNSYMFKQFFDCPLLKVTLIMDGLVAVFVPVFYYRLMKSYPSYEAIPVTIRFALIMAVVIGFSMGAFAKLRFYFKARGQRPGFSAMELFTRLFSRQALMMYPIMMGSIIFFVSFFLSQGMYHLVVPTLAIGIGICFSMIGSFVSALELFIFGNFFLISGVISVPFIVNTPPAAPLWVSGIFGLGMLGLGCYLIFWRRASRKRERETENRNE
ncbi:MAG: solute carrier organic anion transporter [Firmicutes bacterium]|nr:solute carrier organic anion transporter [Bacillota bacterium]